MIGLLLAAHTTGPWELVLIPVALIAVRMIFWRRRSGGGGRGPFGGGGPFGGSGRSGGQNGSGY